MGTSRLSLKLVGMVSGLFLACGILIALTVTYRYSRSLEETAEAHASNLSQAIALEAADKVLINDLVALQKLLDYHLRSHAAVGYLFLVRDGEVLAHTFPGGFPVELMGANTLQPREGGETRRIAAVEGRRFLDIAWPVFGGKGGVLRLGLSEEPYRDELGRLWWQMAAVTGVVLLTGILVGRWFIRRITGPLSHLAQAAETFETDGKDLPVPHRGSDEVAQLTKAFNRMVARVQDHTRRLERKNQDLERSHRQIRSLFTVVQQIGARVNLTEICAYLMEELQKVAVCQRMALLLVSDRGEDLYRYSGAGLERIEGRGGRVAQAMLDGLKGMTFLDRGADVWPLPAEWGSPERLVLFPLRRDGAVAGILAVGCQGQCRCDADSLKIVDLLLSQSAGALRRGLVQEEQARGIRQQVECTSAYCGIVGKDPKMQVIYGLIEDVAHSDAAALIQGESGTGKELVARAIHHRSPRHLGPLMVINCSAYPATLLESELFGHEKGAFTGAIRRKAGRFEQAHGGTVFLDEIGDIPPSAQIKLLRVLQTRAFERVGGEETLGVDVRILSASNKDLMAEVQAGRFREDLFYRLNVIPIHLPPLRERRNDIPLLARHFLAAAAGAEGKNIQGFSPEALRLMMTYDWPGNVRELENSVEHAVVLAKGERIDVADLPANLRPRPEAAAGRARRSTIQESEQLLLRQALESCNWNKKAAAKQLGISRSTLYGKLRKYGITSPTLH